MKATRLKALIGSKIPAGVELYKRLRQSYWEQKPMQSVFAEIHDHNRWDNPESVSGPGSTLSETTVIRDRLPLLLRDLEVSSLLDVPCGDFNWMKEVDLNIERYIGADVVPDLIKRNQQHYGSAARSFVHLDLTRDDLPQVDLILCRDCLFHFSEKAVLKALGNLKASRSKYLLTTTFPNTRNNVDILTGDWRPLNLEIPPFNLPQPLQLIDEMKMERTGEDSGKSLGLWKLDDIKLGRVD